MMSGLKRVGVVVLASVMVLSIAGASAAFAVNGTILNSDHVTETFENEGVYESVATVGQERISEELNTTLRNKTDQIPAGISLNIDNQAAAEAALTEAYVTEEFSTNVEQMLAYLKGDAENLSLQINLVPVKDSLGEYINNDTITVDTVALANERGINVTTAGVTVDSDMIDRLNTNQSGYEGARVQLRSQAVEGTDVPVSIGADGSIVVETETLLRQTDLGGERNNVTVDTAMLVRMNANQSGYADARAYIRSQGLQRAGVPIDVDENGSVEVDTVDISREINLTSGREEVSIDDGMIARLNANQSGYEAVRAEIRAQVRSELPSSATSSQVDTALEEINGELTDSATSQARAKYGENVSEETLDDIIALQKTVIDGLTHPDLTDFDEYTSRRDANETAVEESLTAELDDRLRDVNDAIKADAAEQVRAEYGDDVAEETIADVIGLQNTIIDGLTHPALTEYDDYTSQRDDAEAALEESFDQELSNKLREAGTDVKADAADRIRNEYGDQISENTIEDVVALQNVVVDGLTHPTLTYTDYASRRNDAEAALEASLAAEFNERIDDQVDDQIELGNVTGEQADALNTVRAGVGVVGTLTLVLPLVFLALIGVVYAITRSIHRTVTTTGYSLVVAGLIGAVVGILMSGPVLTIVDTALEPSAEELADTGVADAIHSLIEGLFSTLTMQSVVLTLTGIVFVVVVIATKRDIFERFTSN